MAEQNDKGQEQGQEQANTDASKEEQNSNASGTASGTDWEAQAKHFQGLFNKTEEALKKVQADLDRRTKAQEDAERKQLEDEKKFQELYESEKVKVAESEKTLAALKLQVGLQTHLAEKAPEYVGDFKWIAPHITSEETIASVVEDYVKAHPRSKPTGSASMGNRGSNGGKDVIQISKADVEDPAKVAKLIEKYPDLSAKIDSGEIELV